MNEKVLNNRDRDLTSSLVLHRRLNEPDGWFAKSLTLHDAAIAIFNICVSRIPEVECPQIQLAPLMLMLAAYSTENLLKSAIRAKCGLELTRKEEDELIYRHGLELLLKDAGIRVSKEGRLILKELNDYTLWEARYATPKKWEDSNNRSQLIISSSDVTNVYIPLFESYTEFRRQLMPRVRKLCVKWKRNKCLCGCGCATGKRGAIKST